MKGSPSVNQPRIRAVTNWIFLRAAGPDRPRVILPEKVFPAARELEERFPALRAEIDALLEKRTIPAYGAFDPVRAAQVSEDWKLYYAYMYGQSNELARDEVPTLLSFAQSRPEVVNAFVSILDPGVELPPHKDPYAGVLRYHLGVRVPRVNPPHIRLDQDRHTWKEGRAGCSTSRSSTRWSTPPRSRGSS